MGQGLGGPRLEAQRRRDQESRTRARVVCHMPSSPRARVALDSRPLWQSLERVCGRAGNCLSPQSALTDPLRGHHAQRAVTRDVHGDWLFTAEYQERVLVVVERAELAGVGPPEVG